MTSVAKLKFDKTLNQLPSVLDKNTIYFNLKNNEVEVYITDMDGNNALPVSSKKSFDNLQYSKVVAPGGEVLINITDHDRDKTYSVSCTLGIIDIPIDTQSGNYGNIIVYTAPDTIGNDTIVINDESITIQIVEEVIAKPVIISPASPYASDSSLDGINLKLVLSDYNCTVPTDTLKNVYVKIIDPIFNPYYNEDWKSFVVNINDITYDVVTNKPTVYIYNLYLNEYPNGRFEISVMYESENGVRSEYSDIFHLSYTQPVQQLNYIPVLDSNYPLVSPNNLGIYPGNLSLRISQDYLFSNPEIGQLVYHYLQVSRDFEFVNTIIDSDAFPIDLSNNVIDISNVLDYSTTFYARVYCKFSNIDALSVWSGVQTFTTSPMKPIENPLILSFGTIAGTNRIRATLSSFTEYYRSYHGYTQWQIATDSNFTNLIYDLNGINGYFTDFDSINANLNYSTGYFLRARWYDNNGRVSDWSGFEYIVTEAPVIDSEPSLLSLHFNDVNGSTNIVDSGQGNRPVNVVGNAYITNVITRNSSNVLYTDGNGSYIYVPARSSDVPFNVLSSGDFTTQLWSYIPSDTLNVGVLLSRQQNGNGGAMQLAYYKSTRKIGGFVRGLGGGYQVSLSTKDNGFEFDTWTHIALIRKNTVYLLILNGIVQSAFKRFANDSIADLSYIEKFVVGAVDDGVQQLYFSKAYYDDILYKNTSFIDTNANSLYTFKYKVYATNGLFINEFNDFSDMIVWYCNYWNAGATVGDVSVTISDINPGNGNILYDINSTIYGTRLGVIEGVKIPK